MLNRSEIRATTGWMRPLEMDPTPTRTAPCAGVSESLPSRMVKIGISKQEKKSIVA